MLKCKNIDISAKRDSKFICPYDTLRAYTFRVRLQSLKGRYAHAYDCARNFLRHVHNAKELINRNGLHAIPLAKTTSGNY